MTTLIPKFDLKDGGSTPTGAINRSINFKLADTVSIKDFGAVGNGVTDDTAAIQAAINYGKDVYVPYTSASYLVTGLTFATQGQSFYGSGNNSLLKLANGSNKSLITVSANYVTIRDLGMDCNKANQSTIVDSLGSGVWTTGVSNLTVLNCSISNPVRNGIASSFSNQNCLYQDNRIANAGFIGIYNINSGFPLTNSVITGNIISSPGQDGIGTVGIQNCTISNNTVISPVVAGISLEAACNNTSVIGNTIKGAGVSDTSNGIQTNDSYNVSITGNSLNGLGFGTVVSGTGTNTNSISIVGNNYYQCGNNDAAIEVQSANIQSPSFLSCYNPNVTISGNTIFNSPKAGILINASSNVSVVSNQINNFATTATSTSSNRNLGGIVFRQYSCYNIASNNSINDNASSALKIGIIEVNDGGTQPAKNIIDNNIITNLVQDICITFSGQDQSSVLRKLGYSVAPTTYTWATGQSAYNSFPAAAGYIGWVSTSNRGGSFGSYSTTGSITSGSYNLTVASTDGIFEGMSISIVNALTASTPLVTVVISVNRTTKILNLVDAAGNTVTGSAVTLNNPTFKTWGVISA